MSVQQLPMLSEVLGMNRSSVKGWQEWFSAIAALQSLLQPITEGLILSSPAPVVNISPETQDFLSVVFTPTTTEKTLKASYLLTNGQTQKLSRQPLVTLETFNSKVIEQGSAQEICEVSLSVQDRLQNEQFCLVFTAEFSLLMVLTFQAGETYFDFSFDPEVTQQAWFALRSRIESNSPHFLNLIEQTGQKFPLCDPHYQLVSNFTRKLLNYLSTSAPTQEETFSESKTSPDLELLQALTHEVRTPLTTIRMLTRLLLKRKDLNGDVLKRLRVIDQECTEQINRMELIFQATELEGKNETKARVNLTSIPLEELFAKSIPYWKKQAKRRNVELDVTLPETLPTVMSNPELLMQVLTGLMENITSRLPTGAKMNIQVMTVGNQIKLQLLPENSSFLMSQFSNHQSREKSIGQLLTLQPETGSLSLNLSVTKSMFEALGGKLTVRQRAEIGEVLTVFLPAKTIKN